MSEELYAISEEVKEIKNIPNCAIDQITKYSNQIKAGMRIKLTKHLLNKNLICNSVFLK